MLVDLPHERPGVFERGLRLASPWLLGGLLGLLVAHGGLLVGVALLALPLGVAGLAAILGRPLLGLAAATLAGFFGAGLSRYVAGPTGLLVDVALALTLVAVLLRPPTAAQRARLRSGLTVVVLIWLAYNVLEIANPEAPSLTAWFFAVRGVALYPALAVPLALVLVQRRDLDRFVWLWLGLSLLGTFWGLKQLHVGLDGAEQSWLAVPGNRTTHLLFGKLRVFSFYSDSGQFGAAQGHAAVLALVLALGPGSLVRRLGFAAIGAASLWGLLISGTRGALAVPLVGLFVYFLLSRNWKILATGLLLLAAVYGLLRFTHVAHGVYEVRRMRTAVVEGGENASLQVRLANQRRLAAYLATRPFGGGVGSAGSWGQRFSPGTFLADLALDSWYVKIWAEQGPVGLALYAGLHLYLLAAGLRRLLAVQEPALRQRLAALYAGFCGILVASYGNQVLGQVPTGLLLYFSLAFLFLGPQLEREGAGSQGSSIP